MDIDINKCTINAAIVAFESQVDNLKISLLDKNDRYQYEENAYIATDTDTDAIISGSLILCLNNWFKNTISNLLSLRIHQKVADKLRGTGTVARTTVTVQFHNYNYFVQKHTANVMKGRPALDPRD